MVQCAQENLPWRIIEWYTNRGRMNLPWRRTKNPYRILVAELMLQRTHAIQQVLPIYTHFLKKYPNWEILSRASLSELKKMVASLGLQNIRSRKLKKVASVVCNKFDGKVPREKGNLLSLPGVGEYIANAVLCMAFNKPEPMVDSNFGRVLGRVFYGKAEYPPSKGGTWKIARDLLPETRFKEFNLGVIDLGALVCKPKSPDHVICPISEGCMFLNSVQRRMDPQSRRPLKRGCTSWTKSRN